jgi:hypothetical protein
MDNYSIGHQRIPSIKDSIWQITPTEKKNETKQNLFIYSITMFQIIC